METLKSCPFCGNTSETKTPEGKIIMTPVTMEQKKGQPMYGIPDDHIYFYVKCRKCGAKGGIGTVGYNGLTKESLTEEQAKEIAIEKWNTRKGV